MDGVQEEATAFEGPDYLEALVGTPFEGVRRFRTFGPDGPMYEVTAIEGDQLRIWLYNSWKEAPYPIAEALLDPLKT